MEPIIFRGKSFQASKWFFEGTHRIYGPETTWDKIERYATQIGMTRMAHISGLDRIGIRKNRPLLFRSNIAVGLQLDDHIPLFDLCSQVYIDTAHRSHY